MEVPEKFVTSVEQKSNPDISGFQSSSQPSTKSPYAAWSLRFPGHWSKQFSSSIFNMIVNCFRYYWKIYIEG